MPIHLADREAIVAHFGTNIAGYESAGAASADIAALDARDQGNAAAAATVRWQVRGPDAGLLREFETTHQL